MTTDPRQPGPLDRTTALAVLARADELLEADEPEAAAAHYQRVIGFDDPAVTASAYYGLGNALYRMDREDDAVATWGQVLGLPETPSTYLAWRQIAAARVRDGDLAGAIKAYREADRRAPAEDKPEIASRLGWLAKETGDTRGAARQFRRSRGGSQPTLTYALIAITSIVSFTAYTGITTLSRGRVDFGELYSALWLNKADIAAGQLWRLVTVTLVHSPNQVEFFLHLGFNMYALYLVGPVVESIFGWSRMLVMYVLAAICGSVASFVFSAPYDFAVGASGAIFGLFGVLLVASRRPPPGPRPPAAGDHDPGRHDHRAQPGDRVRVGRPSSGSTTRPTSAGSSAASGSACSSCRRTPRRCPRCGRAPAGEGSAGGRRSPSSWPASRCWSGWSRSGSSSATTATDGAPTLPRARAHGRRARRDGAARPLSRSSEAADLGQAGRRGTRGRRTLTRAPCGATCSATARPPWASASSRTIARPRPLPAPARDGSPR